jgi:hypothetical protein
LRPTCYHLPLAAWEHGLFAREMPRFLHLADICTLVNGRIRQRISLSLLAPVNKLASDYAEA